MKKLVTLALAFTICAVPSTALKPALAQVAIATQGKSNLAIVIPAAAPPTVQSAAAELQKCVQLATGALLPVQKDDAPLNMPFISLGSTQQAQAAGLSTAGLDEDAYRIVTKDGNLFIYGQDTPDGSWTADNGFSKNTANGVYALLEEHLGVRWLMPGEMGRDVPQRPSFTVPALNVTHKPKLVYRRLTHIWDEASTEQRKHITDWMERQRIDVLARRIGSDHNWWQTVNGRNDGSINTPEVRALHQAHPEWFAMDSTGQRPLPDHHRDKFETTNPELVKWYAERAIATLKRATRPYTYSLSPSDGGGWSQSPESKALYDPPRKAASDFESAGGPGMSSLVLKWYHDIAEIVAKEYPEGRLAGYIYADYLYPPTKYQMRLPDNFTPMIAPSINYGYGLYRPETQKAFAEVLAAWEKVAPRQWFYYDLPNQFTSQDDTGIGLANFPGTTGIVTSPAPSILNVIFPELVKNRIQGGIIYGTPSWSNAALGNYLLSRLYWDPSLNANDVQREWLHRAYGDKAGSVMEQFYNRLDQAQAEYIRNHPNVGYQLPQPMLKDVYAAQYPELEKLLLQAKAQPMSEVQKARLQLIEDNMIVLQWRLRQVGFLTADYISPLQRNNAHINTLLGSDYVAFPLFPGAIAASSAPLPKKIQAEGGVQQVSTAKYAGLGDSRFLLYARQDGDICIKVESVTHGAYFGVYSVQDRNGRVVSSGLLDKDASIVIPAKAGEAYQLFIPARKSVNYQLRIENAATATGTVAGDGALTLQGKAAPVLLSYVTQSSPIGVFEEEGSVVLKKPFSGALAHSVMGDAYTNARVLYSFDEDWKFSPDPENDDEARGVLQADFNDSSWKSISPLNWWQMQGFPNYRGVAWYRLKFNHDQTVPKNDGVRLYFGAIDGNADIYLNGRKLLTRNLPADFRGWDQPLSKSIKTTLVPGENTIVVKVTSKSNNTASGIFKGAAIVAGTPKLP